MENTATSPNTDNSLSSLRAPAPFKPACWPTVPPPAHRFNPKTRKSSLRYTTASEFPSPVPAPVQLPLRLPPQIPLLATLDARCVPKPNALRKGDDAAAVSKHKLPCQPMGNPYGKGYDSAHDETRNEEALKQLEAHIKQRVPYVQLASSRLQAALSIRNEMPFNLPPAPKLMSASPAFRNVQRASVGMDIDTKTGVKAKSRARGLGGVGEVPRPIKRPLKMHSVDTMTGRGLREFLLARGKEVGHRRRECMSISIHDFTPDMRTLAYQNVLLGHYAVGKGERVVAYEVDLPTVSLDQDTGQETYSSETWLWILIQRPIISFDASDTSTVGLSISGSPDLSSTSDIYSSYSDTEKKDPTALPPNFPSPIPHSWLVFAAPRAHVTVYPESVEKDGASLKAPGTTGSEQDGGKAVHKRVDYDFAHQGAPLFEFSSAGLFAGQLTDFLSVEKMGGFSAEDGYESYSEEEYRGAYEAWVQTGASVERDGFGNMPCPNRGLWWKEFYRRVGEDCERWRKIRRAMGRGKCRIVLRWVETEDGEEHEEEEDDEFGRAGSALGGGCMRSGRGKSLKKKLNASSGVDERMRRLTRSESRRRSGLGLGDPTILVGSTGETKKGRGKK